MTQAERIIYLFGGVRQLATAIGLNRSAVYRWTLPRERKGTGGYIPTAAIPKVKEAADLLGITITHSDWHQ